MKIENNRAIAAEKKTYEIPSVVLTQLMPSTIVLAGSPGTPGSLHNSGQGTENLGPGEVIGG